MTDHCEKQKTNFVSRIYFDLSSIKIYFTTFRYLSQSYIWYCIDNSFIWRDGIYVKIVAHYFYLQDLWKYGNAPVDALQLCISI